MEKATIHLKGGGSFTIEAEKFTVTRNRTTNTLTQINWSGMSPTAAQPLYLDLDEVAAVVVK